MRHLRSTLAVAALLLTCVSAGVFAGPASATTRGHAHGAGNRALPVCTSRQRHRRHHPHCRVSAKSAKGSHKTSKRARHATHSPRAGHSPTKLAAQTPPAVAATIARVLASPCQNTTLTPEAASLALVGEATLCLINQERARHGEQPLSPNHDLEAAARGHNEEMVADDYFAHVSPSGETPLQRIADAGYLGAGDGEYAIGENLAWGTLSLATPQAIVSAWLASPEHLANILEGAYTETGVAVIAQAPSSLAEGQQGAIYAQEFGVIGQ
jgi:uncharacterized protein YkwD